MATFEVPEAKKSTGQDKFAFKIGDLRITVKKAKFMTVGQLEAMEEPGVAINFFGKKGTPAGDALRALKREQFEALLEAWRDDSEVKPGE